MTAKDYIFGYGSLILDSSRAQSGGTGEAYTVCVKGLKRMWCQHIDGVKVTSLGVIEDSEYECNGVLFSVDNLEHFDARELQYGYKRIQIARSQIQGDVPDGTYWAYTTTDPQSPSKDWPIEQSYLDVVITGCLNISEEFTQHFFATTTNWGTIIADRNNPTYPRALSHPDTKRIDSVILKFKKK